MIDEKRYVKDFETVFKTSVTSTTYTLKVSKWFSGVIILSF